MYSVYLVVFRTLRGTVRQYVGYTGCANLKAAYLLKNPPEFMRPMKREAGAVKLRFLERNVKSKGAALALEALHAARAIAKAPKLARGGPWSSSKALGGDALVTIRAVAACRSLVAVSGIAADDLDGALSRHLRNLEFVRPAVAPRGSPVVRGAVVRKASRSGTPGNARRKALVRGGKLKRDSSRLKQLHRGRDPTARRQLETSRRPART